MEQNKITPTETISPILPIEPKFIIENDESPTAIILATAILLSIALGSVKSLVKAILMLSK